MGDTGEGDLGSQRKRVVFDPRAKDPSKNFIRELAYRDECVPETAQGAHDGGSASINFVFNRANVADALRLRCRFTVK
jgi:hypothetical protein